MSPSGPYDSRIPIRRAPYGANPALGRHGNRARLEILDAARHLFAERGFHGTTVEAIGQASGRSGASVYQYFEGKAAIFGVFADELSDEVLASARELGSTEVAGTGAVELAELEKRIVRLSEVLGRHSTTFRLWPVAEQSDPALQGSSLRFVESFADALRPRLEAAGVPADRRRAFAIALGAMVQWSHSTRSERTPFLDKDVLDGVLAGVVHRALFALPDRAGTLSVPGPLEVPRPEGARRTEDSRAVPGVRRPVTERGRATLDRILVGATTEFRRNGFTGTSVNDIAAAAGVSHGSVYTYWPDLGSLFATLAHEAAVELGDHIDQATAGFADTAEACAWVESWLDFVGRHGTVLHTWTHEVLEDENLGPLARDMELYVNAFMDAVLRSAPTAGTVDEDAAHLVMWSLLTDIPYTHYVQMGTLSRPELLEALTVLLLRGLLGLRA